MRFILVLLSVVFLAGSVASADPVEWPVSEGGNGHYYEVIGGRDTPYAGMTWTEADALAKTMSYLGLAGHLATITSFAENNFVSYQSGIVCDLMGGVGCEPYHIGGWSIVIGVIEPRPYNPPYVETAMEQWITGEAGTVDVLPIWSVDGPIGEATYFKWGIFDMDGFGLPSYGLHAVEGPSTANGFVVEYDGMTAYSYPDGSVPTSVTSWGELKSLYR